MEIVMTHPVYLASLTAALLVVSSVNQDLLAQTNEPVSTPQSEPKTGHWPPRREKVWNTLTSPVRIPIRVAAAPVLWPYYGLAANERTKTPVLDVMLAREWVYVDGQWDRSRYVLLSWPYRRE